MCFAVGVIKAVEKKDASSKLGDPFLSHFLQAFADTPTALFWLPAAVLGMLPGACMLSSHLTMYVACCLQVTLLSPLRDAPLGLPAC